MWAHHDEAPLQIAVTDLETTIAEIKEAYPGCVITKGLWTPPAGLKRITEAESDLIIAQSAVDAERALARAAKVEVQAAPAELSVEPAAEKPARARLRP